MKSLILIIVLIIAVVACNQNYSQEEMNDMVSKKVAEEIEKIEVKEKKNIESVIGLLTAFGTGETDKIDEYIHEDFVNHMAPEGLKDRAGFHKIVKNVNSVFAMFDSYDVKPAHIFSKGDYVAMMDLGFGVKNGNEFKHTDFHIFKMKDGKLLEHWNSFKLDSQEKNLQKFLAEK